MGRKLQLEDGGDDETVIVFVKMPAALKGRAVELAQLEHEGNLSRYLRCLLRRAWAAHKSGSK